MNNFAKLESERERISDYFTDIFIATGVIDICQECRARGLVTIDEMIAFLKERFTIGDLEIKPGDPE